MDKKSTHKIDLTTLGTLITTLEKLTKKDTIYKKFSYHPWANNKFQKIFDIWSVYK